MLILALSLTACGQAPTAAEVSALSIADTTAEPAPYDRPAKLCSDVSGQLDTLPDGGGCISTSPYTAASFSNAVITCANSGQALCTKDQMLGGYSKGKVFSGVGGSWYWMQKVAVGQGFNAAMFVYTPVAYATGSGTNKFYCCTGVPTW